MTTGYLIDIDGTLLRGTTAIDGAREFIADLASGTSPFLLMTNSISSPEAIARKLGAAGIMVPPARIRNPISAINSYLEHRQYRRCFVVGSDLEAAQVVAPRVDTNPEVVILLDFEKGNVGFDVLQKVVDLARSDVPVVAASGSKFYLKDGSRTIDTGSFVTLVEGVSARPVEVFGKPSRRFFAPAIDDLGCPPDCVLVVGDDWSTDVLGGQGCGTRTALVRTGKYEPGDEGHCHPDTVVGHLMEIRRGPSVTPTQDPTGRTAFGTSPGRSDRGSPR